MKYWIAGIGLLLVLVMVFMFCRKPKQTESSNQDSKELEPMPDLSIEQPEQSNTTNPGPIVSGEIITWPGTRPDNNPLSVAPENKTGTVNTVQNPIITVKELPIIQTQTSQSR